MGRLENLWSTRGALKQVAALKLVTAYHPSGPILLGSDHRLYRYESGVWSPDGDAELQTRLFDLLGEELSADMLHSLYTLAKAGYADIDIKAPVPNHYINVANGCIDLSTDREPTLQPHDRSLYFVHQAPHAWDQKAESGVLNDYMASNFDAAETEFIYEVMGYCLLPYFQLKRAFLLYSPKPHTGKSTFLRLLTDMVGWENTATVSLQALDDDRFQRAELQGKYLNVAGDLSGRAPLSSNTFKSLVGGDGVNVERKGQQGFTMYNTAKMLFASNELPQTADQTKAYFDRWWVIPFTHQHVYDPNFENALRAADVQAAVLNHAIRGAHRLYHRREFAPPEIVRRETARYANEANSVVRFLQDACIKKEGNRLKSTSVYRRYHEWSKDNGHQPVARPKFEARMADQDAEGVRVIRLGGRVYLEGIGLPLVMSDPDHLAQLEPDATTDEGSTWQWS